MWRTIVDVITMGMWVSWITDYKRAPQPVAILVQKVTVVPECALNHGYREFASQCVLGTYRLLWNIEFVLELIVWYDGTLSHECSPIKRIKLVLIDTVPVL